MEKKLTMLRRLVAQPINGQDTCPSQAPHHYVTAHAAFSKPSAQHPTAQVGEGLFVGNKRHVLGTLLPSPRSHQFFPS